MSPVLIRKRYLAATSFPTDFFWRIVSKTLREHEVAAQDEGELVELPLVE
jgi:hypothetical protein